MPYIYNSATCISVVHYLSLLSINSKQSHGLYDLALNSVYIEWRVMNWHCLKIILTLYSDNNAFLIVINVMVKETVQTNIFYTTIQFTTFLIDLSVTTFHDLY